MALGPRLELRQSQSLVMTPQLQQAIRLLALSNLEVESFIAEEIEKNPLLEAGAGEERAARGRAEAGDDGGDGEPRLARNRFPRRRGRARHRRQQRESPPGQRRPIPCAASMAAWASRASAPAAVAEDGPDFDSFAGDGLSLHEHLRAQAGEALRGADLLDRRAADRADRGDRLFHRQSARHRADASARRSPTSSASSPSIQTFDPAGIAARNLAECLALQAKDANRYDPAMARLIANLDYLAKGNVAALKRICQVDDEDMADMIRELRAYDPKPGCRFSAASERIEAVVPDIFVARRGGRLGGRAEQRDLAEAARQPLLLSGIVERPAGQAVQGLAQRMSAKRQLADEGARSARPHHRQGGERDRHPAGRLLPPRRQPPEAAHLARRRRDDRHARIDGEPGHLEQIYVLRARPLRAQIFLHQRHPEQ